MFWLFAACAPLPVGPPPPAEMPCPADMLDIGGGEAILGHWDPRYYWDQVPPIEVEVERFCTDRYPFPGQADDHWPEDGVAAGDVEAWVDLLASYGRRLCRVEELLWLSAYGPVNRPFLTGDHRGQACEPDSSWGDMDTLGHWEWCRNPFDVRAFNVVSSWAIANADIDDARGMFRRRPYLVAGGTNRPDTFYAPNNFGLHAHDPGDPPFFDDQLRICADPGAPEDGGGWMIFREAAELQGTYAGALAWHRAHGTAASPTQVIARPVVHWPR